MDDRELLARIIRCEAGGEGDDGMRAVATVLMNRVHATEGEYARIATGGLRNIVFQPRQFECTLTSRGGVPVTYNIYSNPPEPVHYEIADWAIAGGKLNAVGDALWFYRPNGNCRDYFPGDSGIFAVRINNHCFFIPTDAYRNT